METSLDACAIKNLIQNQNNLLAEPEHRLLIGHVEPEHRFDRSWSSTLFGPTLSAHTISLLRLAYLNALLADKFSQPEAMFVCMGTRLPSLANTTSCQFAAQSV